MKISNREKILLVVFVTVAILILLPSGNNNSENEQNTKITPKFTRILKRYQKIQNLKKFERETTNNITTNIKRNIFKFGQPKQQKIQRETQQEKQVMQQIEETQKTKQTSKQIKQEPQLPEVNFKVEGIIRTKTGNAVVISKSPELFVIRENKKFFNKFIFKKVNEKNIVLGFIGFDTEKIIPIEDRGF
jgi:hypothetical protein